MIGNLGRTYVIVGREKIGITILKHARGEDSFKNNVVWAHEKSRIAKIQYNTRETNATTYII